MKELNYLLGRYRSLIDFTNKMEASNYKWINSALLFYQRKDKENWVDNSIQLLRGAILNLERYRANLPSNLQTKGD